MYVCTNRGATLQFINGVILYFLERIRISHGFGSQVIFNNTVINTFRILAFKREASTDFVYEAPAQVENDGESLSVTCTGVQGDHQVIWTTDNVAVGGEDGVVNCDPRPNTQRVLSNYSSRYMSTSIS